MTRVDHCKNEKSEPKEYGIVFSYAKIAIFLGRHDFYIRRKASNGHRLDQ